MGLTSGPSQSDGPDKIARLPKVDEEAAEELPPGGDGEDLASLWLVERPPELPCPFCVMTSSQDGFFAFPGPPGPSRTAVHPPLYGGQDRGGSIQ